MNNEKIDLILRGVNLLVMNSELNIEFKTDFNKSFRECFDKEASKKEDCCEMPKKFAVQKKEEPFMERKTWEEYTKEEKAKYHSLTDKEIDALNRMVKNNGR